MFKQLMDIHNITPKMRVTVALSGGPDSVALASLVSKWWSGRCPGAFPPAQKVPGTSATFEWHTVVYILVLMRLKLGIWHGLFMDVCHGAMQTRVCAMAQVPEKR